MENDRKIIIEEKIKREINHDVIFEDNKKINKKYYKIIRSIFERKYFERKVCAYALIVVILLCFLIILFLIILSISKNNWYVFAIITIITIILFCLRNKVSMFDLIDSLINYVGGHVKIDRYQLFVDIFIRRNGVRLDEKEIICNYLLIKKFNINEKGMGFYRDIINITVATIFGFIFSPLQNIINGTNSICISILYLILVIAYIAFITYMLTSMIYSIVEMNDSIEDMYIALLLNHSDADSFIEYMKKYNVL